MNTFEFEKIIGSVHRGEPIVLESGIYDARDGVIHADGGIIISEPDTVLKNATVLGCITVTGKGSVVQSCMIKAESHAIFVAGSDISVRGCEIEAASAILIEPYSENILLAQNNTHGDIRIDGVTNCSLVLNKAKRLTVENSRSVAIAECDLEGKVTLKGNDYLICDNNCASVFESIGNTNTNGSNITDIYYRPEFGANEDILPKVNKELFVGSVRRSTVRDGKYDKPLGFNEYVRREAEASHVVIVPPGAYAVDEGLRLCAEQSNSKIYAYGVYHELSDYGNLLYVSGAENIELHGLISGYAKPSCGQGYVLDVIDDYSFLFVPAPWSDGFGHSNKEKYKGGMVNIWNEGIAYPWGAFNGDYTIEALGDGTYKVTLTEGSTKIGQVKRSDILACRIAGNNLQSITVLDSHNVLLCDYTLYGYASALAIVASGDTTGARIERFTDTVKSAPIVDEKTYLWYKSLEEKYGASVEAYIDSKGRYRCGIPRVSSVDATHISGSRQGLDATSSVFDSMCDDGTNQRASSARLAALTDNGNGTTTVQYKGCATLIYFNIDNKPTGSGSMCQPFKEGDNILIYASNGKTVCNTHTLTATREVGAVEFRITEGEKSKDYTVKLCEVTVPTADVNFSAVEGYDLTDNHFRIDNKAFVDNLDRNSANYTFDNVLMSNARGRGALIKTSGVTIRSCTFRHMLHAGIMVSAEATWGESTIGTDTVIEKCLFDHTGYTNNDNVTRRYCAINITGAGDILDEECMPYRDITIRKNKFTNITHECFAYIKSAQKITIEDNIFERAEGCKYEKAPIVLDAESVFDITLRGNKYPVENAKADEIVIAKNYRNITVEDNILTGDTE